MKTRGAQVVDSGRRGERKREGARALFKTGCQVISQASCGEALRKPARSHYDWDRKTSAWFQMHLIVWRVLLPRHWRGYA